MLRHAITAAARAALIAAALTAIAAQGERSIERNRERDLADALLACAFSAPPTDTCETEIAAITNTTRR